MNIQLLYLKTLQLGYQSANWAQVEKMQALLGSGTTVMNAIQMAADQEREMDMNFDEDEDMLALAAEVLGKKASRLEFKLGQARNDVVATEAKEKKMVVALKKAREQVSQFQVCDLFRSLVDANPEPVEVVGLPSSLRKEQVKCFFEYSICIYNQLAVNYRAHWTCTPKGLCQFTLHVHVYACIILTYTCMYT